MEEFAFRTIKRIISFESSNSSRLSFCSGDRIFFKVRRFQAARKVRTLELAWAIQQSSDRLVNSRYMLAHL